MASYWSFGHLQLKLWAKEGPGVKLPIRLPTTKSRESTSSRHPILECDTALESSGGELQLWFRPCRDRILQSGVMSSQSPGTPTGIVSGLQLGSPGKKNHLDVASVESCKEYYMGEGGGFSWISAVVSQVSQVSPRLPVACSNTKRVQNEFSPTCGWFWCRFE
jgi:hypothetical protein